MEYMQRYLNARILFPLRYEMHRGLGTKIYRPRIRSMQTQFISSSQQELCEELKPKSTSKLLC